MQAVMKQATVPAIMALMAPPAMSLFLVGAMDAEETLKENYDKQRYLEHIWH